MTNCIFCKIINKEIPSEVVYEDEKTIVFKDIHPKAPIHLLVVPKEHLSTINDLKTENSEFAGNLILVAKKVAEKEGFLSEGYKLVFNVGRGAGQLIDHIHLHILSGGYHRPLSEI